MRFKQYAKEFFESEDGSEMLQTAVNIIMSVGLISVVGYLFYSIGKQIGNAGDQVSSMNTNADYTTNPYSSVGGTPPSTQQ